MKRSIKLIVVSFCIAIAGFAQNEMVLEGTYQGDNLYVQNPFASSGVGFCIIDVKINGQTSIDEINSSAFEIDFSSYQLKQGEPVIVKITYKDGCSPRVINPEVLRPSSSFVIKSIEVKMDGTLSWTTTNESGALPYYIEQYRWNKWIRVGEVEGKGTKGEHTYNFKVNLHSGRNKFRIKQVDFSKKPRYSNEVELRRSPVSEVFIGNEDPTKIETSIRFVDENGKLTETMYEVMDQYGSLVRKGFGKEVDVKSLNRGIYYVSYDSKTEQVEIK
jgi:hypothetical protein